MSNIFQGNNAQTLISLIQLPAVSSDDQVLGSHHSQLQSAKLPPSIKSIGYRWSWIMDLMLVAVVNLLCENNSSSSSLPRPIAFHWWLRLKVDWKGHKEPS